MAVSASAPVWLHEEPEIVALLSAALDRFDRQPAEERERDVSLPAERFLSSLSRSDQAADQLWKLVAELQRIGVLRIRPGRPGPYDPCWKGARVAFSADGEGVLRGWLQRERLPSELSRWRDAVAAHAHLFPGGCNGLFARRIAIEGRSSEEVVAAFARIAAVNGPVTLRQLSALCFWGDSKLLDERGELIAALFPQLAVRDRAILVAVHLPESCEGVLFIENQDTYTTACGGSPVETAHLALVFASGFRSSAERVRSVSGAVLHFAGPGTEASAGCAATDLRRRFERWWFEQREPLGPCWFWGDLDFAGMQILKSLRSRFPELTAWQPGYGPMLEAVSGGSGCSSAAAPSRGQVDPGETGCAYADEQLLPAIRRYGALDQEHPIGRGSG